MRPAWMERPSVVTRALKPVVLVFVVVVTLFPFWEVVAVSFASDLDVLRGGLIVFPAHASLVAYESILRSAIVVHSLFVSVGVTIAGTAMSMLLTATMAYALTRTRDVPGIRFVLFMVLGTLLFSPGIIPTFLVVKQLGLLNTYASLVLPSAVSAFNLVVLRQFFISIPSELFDSARIDGANDVQILTRLVLPLSRAVLAVIALFYAVAIWNEYFNALLYLNDAAMWPVQLVLRQYVLVGSPLADLHGVSEVPPPAESIRMAVVVLGTLPIVLVYPFLQRYFTRSVLTGAIKG